MAVRIIIFLYSLLHSESSESDVLLTFAAPIGQGTDSLELCIASGYHTG